MHPILFRLPDSLGGMEIPTYGVMMALGMLVGALVFARLAGKLGWSRNACFEAALETMLVALLASKVVGLIFQPAAGDLPLLQLIGRTGGVWYIGFLTGVGWATWRFGRMRMPVRQGLDCAAAAVATGHAFGRIGCFFAGCCWGGACTAPWAVTFTDPRAHELTGVPLGIPLHPVQLYEAGAEILTAGLLILMISKRWYRFHLQPGLTYLLLYGFVRFSLEFLRNDPRGVAGVLSTSQWIALAVVGLALPLYILGLVRGTVAPWAPRVPKGDARVAGAAPRADEPGA